MRLVGALTVAIALIALQLSHSSGQDGIFSPNFSTNVPTLSNAGSQDNSSNYGLDRTSSEFLNLPQQQSQQPQQPQQAPYGNAQQPQYPQQQQPVQVPPQYPSQYTTPQAIQVPQQQQSTQYPQQSETQYPNQQPQYPQQSITSQLSPIAQQLPSADSDNQSTPDNFGKTNIELTDKLPVNKSLEPDSQVEIQNPTTSQTTATTTSTATTTTAPKPEKTGMDQKNGEAESLVDYALGLAGYKGGSQSKVTDKVSPTPTTSSVSDCNLPASLESCGMPEDVQKYFNSNVSVQGVLASIFKPDIVRMLSQQCQPGSWCLPYDIHLDIMDGMDRFYLDGPFCSAAMWSCMDRILANRPTCDDKKLTFLMDSVKTLCDLSEFGLTNKRCYTRSLEALYVTYANTFPPTDKKIDTQARSFCETYAAKMTKTYLCADDSCSYDQMIILERFQPWVDLVENATAVFTYCNMTKMCQYEDEEDYLEELEEELDDDYEDYAYNYYDSYYYGEDEEVDDDEDDEQGQDEEVEGRGDGETEGEYDDEQYGDFFQGDSGVQSTESDTEEQYGDVGMDN
ncbi:hypothetical protein EGW08_001766, partial [Elysia chlorotica]